MTYDSHRTIKRVREGGQYVTVDAPVDEMPIFVKAGSILPVAEDWYMLPRNPGRAVKTYGISGRRLGFTIYEDEEII